VSVHAYLTSQFQMC